MQLGTNKLNTLNEFYKNTWYQDLELLHNSLTFKKRSVLRVLVEWSVRECPASWGIRTQILSSKLYHKSNQLSSFNKILTQLFLTFQLTATTRDWHRKSLERERWLLEVSGCVATPPGSARASSEICSPICPFLWLKTEEEPLSGFHSMSCCLIVRIRRCFLYLKYFVCFREGIRARSHQKNQRCYIRLEFTN